MNSRRRRILAPALIVCIFTLCFFAGVAIAAVVNCSAGVQCNGTSSADTITGSSGSDIIRANAGNDTVNSAQGGNDDVRGGQGDDTIDVKDGAGGDIVNCDLGFADKVKADRADTITPSDATGAGCETVQIDHDSDGVLDGADNCPDNANPNQADDDSDGTGNACDSTPRGPDTDGDGVPDMDDICQGHDDAADTDSDGTPDGCDPTPNGEAVPPSDCDVIVQPSQNLSQVAANNPAGTKFCLLDGDYEVSGAVVGQSGDHFFGVYNDGSRPQIKPTGAVMTWSATTGVQVTGSTLPNVFEMGSSDGATLEGITIMGGAHNPTSSDSVNTGKGINRGLNLTLRNVRATLNENSGSGGAHANLRVYDSMFDRNGNPDSSYNAGSLTSSAGIKTVNTFYIENSSAVNNFWNGFWCDLSCGAFEIHDSVMSGNGKAGFHYEVSSGPSIIEGNTFQNNGHLVAANRHVGLLVVSSRNLDAYGNTFGGNRDWGVQIVEDSRDPVTGNINIHHNTMNGDPLTGCNLSGVSCTNNTP